MFRDKTFKGKIIEGKIEEMDYGEVVEAIKEVSTLLKESDDSELYEILMRLIERRDQFRPSCNPFLLRNKKI
ncbi:MAG: hypothetical protein ACE5K4_07170 [Candidatus Hydrothermarchaeota archaeon]